MPAKPVWFQRLDRIIREIGALDCPVIDRQIVEKTFGLSRRGAIHLLNRFGALRLAGGILVIARPAFLEKLQTIRESPERAREIARQRRVAEDLETLRKLHPGRQVAIRVITPGVPVRLADGEVHIAYTGPEDLLSKLYALARFAATDYEEFCRLTTPERPA